MESNVRVPIALIHAVLPSMISRNSGTIISTTSVTAVLQMPFISAQGVSDAALLKFHHQLHLETAQKGIQSFAVNPGLVPSHIHDPASPVVLDPDHLSQEHDFLDMMSGVAKDLEWSAAGLASGTFLALCAEPRTKILSGLYVNAERDLEELIGLMERDWGRKVKRGRLYVMKVDEY